MHAEEGTQMWMLIPSSGHNVSMTHSIVDLVVDAMHATVTNGKHATPSIPMEMVGGWRLLKTCSQLGSDPSGT